MSLRSFLYREARWLRHNWGVLLIVLVLLPSLFAASTGAFQQVIPRDTPVAIVPADDSVTDDELTSVTGVAAFFSRPHEYDSRAAATRALHREDVYAAFVVPHGLFDADRSVTIEMVVEEEMVPYEQPSIAISGILRGRIGDAFPATVSVERTTIGEARTLSEFLIGPGVLLLAMIYAFIYLPHVLSSERRVFRRVRVESSLWQLLAVKLAVFTLLLFVPLAAVQASAVHFGFDVAPLAPGAAAVVLGTFLALAAVAVGVTFLFRFRPLGRMVNAGLLFGTVVFGNVVYPAGFFSPLRRTIARANPVHHAMTVQRGVSLKGHPPDLYADKYGLLAAFLLAAVAFLVAAVYAFQRGADR